MNGWNVHKCEHVKYHDCEQYIWNKCEIPDYVEDASRGSLYVRERYPEDLRARISERNNPGHGDRADCNWELYNCGPRVGGKFTDAGIHELLCTHHELLTR